MCTCKFWGENRADELFLDVGCVLGYCLCKSAECPDYRELEAV